MDRQITRNRRASLLLAACLIAVLGALGTLLGYAWTDSPRGSLLMLTLFACVGWLWAVVAYFAGGRIVAAETGADEVTREQQPRLWSVVEELCLAAGLPRPRICVISDPAPNAFAAGRDPRHALVAVTSGLVARLTRRELQGVVAHELAHVRNRDICYGTLTSVVVGLAAVVSIACWRVGELGLHAAALLFGMGRAPRRRNRGARGRRRKQEQSAVGPIVALALMVAVLLALLSGLLARLAYLATLLLHYAFVRRRELLADATAVEFTRDPLALAAALEKISAYSGALRGASAATAHLFIVDPFGHLGDAWLHLLDTHPPVEARIAALRAMTPSSLPTPAPHVLALDSRAQDLGRR